MLAVRDISERKEAAARIAHLAYHDALTGLPNRAVFAEQLARSVERGRGGRRAGGGALHRSRRLQGGQRPLRPPGRRRIAGRGRATAALGGRGDELVARLGGDEFAIVQRGGEPAGPCRPALASGSSRRSPSRSTIDGESVADQRQHRRRPLPRTTRRTPSDLVKNADMALYRAKARRPRPHPLLRGGDGRGAAPAPPARGRSPPGDRRDELERPLPAARRPRQRRASSASRRCCAGTIPSSARSARTCSSRSPRRAASSSRSATGCCAQACGEAATLDPPLQLSVNLSPVQFIQDDLAAEVEAILQRDRPRSEPARPRDHRRGC